MSRLIGGVVRLALAAFTAFFVGALAFAASRKRDAPPASSPDSDEIRLTAIFEPVDFTSAASALRGGSIECLFGGGEIDLRGATLDPAGATIRTTAVFGGANIVVPGEWRVTNRVIGVFGGAGDARGASPAPDAPHLTIDGVAIFGGWGITSAKGRESRMM